MKIENQATLFLSEEKVKRIIIIVSIVIPVAVAGMFFSPVKFTFLKDHLSFFPAFHATLNFITTLLLLVALYFVKNKIIKAHRNTMLAAFALSSVFLVSYVLYHLNAPTVRFGDADHDGIVSAVELEASGGLRGFYFFILVSHILLAILILPFILTALFLGLTNQVFRHKKIVRYTFPIWLYVTSTGVLVYLLIEPYYPW
jgi:putative membrane protein